MRRGDIVTVAVNGDYGKPRPAVIVQSDEFPADHASIVVCQMTSEFTFTPDFRINVEANELSGLRVRSQVMVDKPMTVKLERVGAKIGRLTLSQVLRLNTAIAFVMGLAD